MAEVAPDILEGTWHPPVSEGTGFNRGNLSKALALLKEAGYELRDGKLVLATSGEPLSFEILLAKRDQERLINSYAAGLAKVGIVARVRVVDSAQMQDRQSKFDFDMMPFALAASLSPGNEQLFRWASAQAGNNGSFNLAGVKSPAADAMIAAMLAARDREGFVAAVRALDRVLLSGDYVLPLFHLKTQLVAHASWLRYPATTSLYGYQVDTWWADAATAPQR
jgi:peptide/nickel transport system substrate-binding protein